MSFLQDNMIIKKFPPSADMDTATSGGMPRICIWRASSGWMWEDLWIQIWPLVVCSNLPTFPALQKSVDTNSSSSIWSMETSG